MNDLTKPPEDLKTDKEKDFLKNPIIMSLLFLVVSLLFRIIDIFVLNLDETPFNIIISKIAPLSLMLIYVGLRYRSFSPLGIHKTLFIKNVILGLFAFLFFYGMNFFIGYFLASLFNYNPMIRFTDFDIFYLMYFLTFLIINSFMEEGLFRGFLMRTFMTRISKRTSNLIQAFLFGLWHLVWPIQSAIDGNGSSFFIGIYALYYVFFSFLFGFLAGYIFQKSSSLINCVVFHTLWNFFVSFVSLIYTSDLNIQQVVFTYIMETVSLGLAFIISFFLLIYILRKTDLPTLNPWNEPISSNS